ALPWSPTTLQTGGGSRALTSVYWPGDTGGHGGDTLSLLGVPCIVPNPGGALPVDPPCLYQPSPPPPAVYDQLNDPYKAEAQSGHGKSTDSQTGNGVDMTATATQTNAAATTTMSGSQIPSVGDQFGKTVTATKI